jgi:hypothetical protein
MKCTDVKKHRSKAAARCRNCSADLKLVAVPLEVLCDLRDLRT